MAIVKFNSDKVTNEQVKAYYKAHEKEIFERVGKICKLDGNKRFDVTFQLEHGEWETNVLGVFINEIAGKTMYWALESAIGLYNYLHYVNFVVDRDNQVLPKTQAEFDRFFIKWIVDRYGQQFNPTCIAVDEMIEEEQAQRQAQSSSGEVKG